MSIVSLASGGDSPVPIVATPSNTGPECKVIMQRPVALKYQPLPVTRRDDIITRSPASRGLSSDSY